MWEYCIENGEPPIKTKRLNKLGLDGWELVCYTPENEKYYSTLIFKRPLVVPAAPAAEGEAAP